LKHITSEFACFEFSSAVTLSLPICRQQNGTSAEEDNYNADVDGEGN